MALTTIEYGALASSKTMNDNFEYLDNRITQISEALTSNTAGIYSNIASINNSISSLRDSLTEDIANLRTSVDSLFSENGLYITTSIDGTSWYREYFSDEDKTERIWLEQSFTTPTITWSANSIKAYNLLKPFSNDSYAVIALPLLTTTGNGRISVPVAATALSKSSVSIVNGAASTFAVRVYACGC